MEHSDYMTYRHRCHRIYKADGHEFLSIRELERYHELIKMLGDGLISTLWVNVVVEVVRTPLYPPIFARLPFSYHDNERNMRIYEACTYHDAHLKKLWYVLRAILYRDKGIIVELIKPVRKRSIISEKTRGRPKDANTPQGVVV